MSRKKITVVGSSNTDMVVKSDHLPVPGETVLGGAFTMNPGGKGANQAVAAASLGGSVTFVARVGNDVFGKQAIAGFQAREMDTRYIRVDEAHPSGVALIMVDERGENCISVALGANAALATSDIDRALPAIQASAFLLLQLEVPMVAVEHAARVARSNEVPVVLNPAPAAPLSDSLLRSLDMITPNQPEAELLTGIQVEDEGSAREAARALREKGVDKVLITMGSKGVFALSDELDQMIPSPRVKAVDTTAAGDTFNGALLVGLAEGMPLKDAIVFANKAAAFSVTRVGAQASAPSREDLLQFD